jgi:leader peptidase (prepilin peptidase)/N-methyltransferase
VIYFAIAIVLIFNFQFLISRQFLTFIFLILSALGAAGFFLLIFLISKGEWLGFGDVKLAFFMGLFLGFPSILIALFLAFLIGAIIGIGLIFVGEKTLKSQVPFGPFLVLGTLIAFFVGEKIINWYLNFI